MSHRQSCDRCRQQKVRCIRDEAQAFSFTDQASLVSCERCLKVGVDCVYSLKQQSTRHAVQKSVRKGQNNLSHMLDSTSLFEQSLNGINFVSNGDLNENGAAFDQIDNSWDTGFQSILSPAAFFNTFSTVSDLAPATEALTSVAMATTRSRLNSSNGLIDDEKDDINSGNENDNVTSTDHFSQLIALSQRIQRAARRLARPGQISLTVSSPEVNETLENTNILIRIINSITAPIPDCNGDNMEITTVGFNSTKTDHGLAFLALACHQHLVALFQAICDTVRRYLQQYRKEPRNYQYSSDEIGPSCVAQFIMVLQLLIHLINRMDRSLGAADNEKQAPVTTFQQHYDPKITKTEISGSSRGGLLVLVKQAVRTIPSEHENLRQVIQELQKEMEHLDFH